ncbi:SafA/ExsA family spore coat assembly protein [Bacillus sp. FJAT-27245]|uniref:SafA/ExsA family spore coat assembly protein n=1 Tax=Bacillus sp. FJAT-27245 TaxID=1684144 RepID=UPI0006A7ABD1|nr:SafA/ExsA family spore coat assembly protein [Bacillus sp. FJAT-27245]
MKKFVLILMVFVMALVAVPGISSAQTIHTVVRGDTLWKISVRYHVGLHELIRANPQFKNPNLIYPGQKVTIPTIGAKSVEQQVISLTNQERAKYGLKALAHDWELSRVARYKSVDMRDKNYFSHTSPTYGSPFTMMKNFGIAYRSAGENIAAGQTTAAEVVRAWMNSPGHRANILNQGYTHIGVGYAAGGAQRHYWTQMFISK